MRVRQSTNSVNVKPRRWRRIRVPMRSASVGAPSCTRSSPPVHHDGASQTRDPRSRNQFASRSGRSAARNEAGAVHVNANVTNPGEEDPRGCRKSPCTSRSRAARPTSTSVPHDALRASAEHHASSCNAGSDHEAESVGVSSASLTAGDSFAIRRRVGASMQNRPFEGQASRRKNRAVFMAYCSVTAARDRRRIQSTNRPLSRSRRLRSLGREKR